MQTRITQMQVKKVPVKILFFIYYSPMDCDLIYPSNGENTKILERFGYICSLYGVAYTAYCGDKLACFAELLSEGSDMHVNSTAFSVKGIAPHTV